MTTEIRLSWKFSQESLCCRLYLLDNARNLVKNAFTSSNLFLEEWLWSRYGNCWVQVIVGQGPYPSLLLQFAIDPSKCSYFWIIQKWCWRHFGLWLDVSEKQEYHVGVTWTQGTNNWTEMARFSSFFGLPEKGPKDVIRSIAIPVSIWGSQLEFWWPNPFCAPRGDTKMLQWILAVIAWPCIVVE